MALIEDACIFHIAKGVGIDDCCVGFERVEVTNCKAILWMAAAGTTA